VAWSEHVRRCVWLQKQLHGDVMSVGETLASTARFSRASVRGERRYGAAERVGLGAVALGGAALAGYALARGHETAAIAICVLPIAAWMLVRPLVPLVLLGVSIPDIQSLTAGHGGFNLSISDLLLVLLGALVLLEATVTGSTAAVRALRPVALPLLQYSGLMLVLLTVHFGVRDVAKTGQRYELFVLPLLVGAYAALTKRHIRVLQAYVVGATALAVLWQIDHFGLQKNPVGQMIANGILLLVGVRTLRAFLPCLLVLVPGVVLTESRGAIGATALGLAVIVAMQGFKVKTILTRAVPLVALAVGVFAFSPAPLQQRVTTFSPSQTTNAGYAIYVRQKFATDARRIISAYPVTGVGVGNYQSADSFSTTPAQDPHDVILLQAAEGGYGLAVSFVLLIVGTSAAMLRMRRANLAPAAAAILIGTFAHGLIDVYWVRGTPVLSWLIVGMVCGEVARRRRAESDP